MSTVHEVLAARHCGMEVLAFSLITNICIVDTERSVRVFQQLALL